MKHAWKLLSVAALVATAGCDDYLTGGALTNDPNRPLVAASPQLFEGAQATIWFYYTGDAMRQTEMWAQHMQGNVGQYQALFRYGLSEQTTNGLHQGLYLGGGLVDIRRLQEVALAEDDTLFLGVAQVQEALLMSVGADVFGDLVYSQALKGDSLPNPVLDPQLDVYDALLAKLDSAIVNLAATGPTNAGPGGADLSYGGDPALWTKLAHTLKARIISRKAEVPDRFEGWEAVATEAEQGITDPSENFIAPFSGAAGEENFNYQFVVVQRADYWTPNTLFVTFLEQRGDDARLADYFNADQSQISDARAAPGFTQPLILANDNLLLWAEAAFRTGNEAVARTQLNVERELAGLDPVSTSGEELLRDILDEKYAAGFQTLEPWNDYKRNCYPNLTPVVEGRIIPARMFYDTQERQTNTSVPSADQQPIRNANDPPNATDPFGDPCLGQ